MIRCNADIKMTMIAYNFQAAVTLRVEILIGGRDGRVVFVRRHLFL
jgi:hypothetical protein